MIPPALTARFKAEAQTDSAIRLERVLRKSGFTGRALLVYYDNLSDADWWKAWRQARCVSAPSDGTRALLRERLREYLFCIACGVMPAVRAAGKGMRPGRDLCDNCSRQESTEGEP